MKKIFLMLPILFTVVVATAQLPTKFILTQKAAHVVMEDALAYAKANNSPGGAIAIVDDGGNLVMLERIDGTFPKAAEVSIHKAQTAALFKKETVDFESKINTERAALLSVGVTMLKGGIPIIYKGQVIGAIGVSGCATAEQDTEVAKAGSKAIDKL